MQGWGQGRRGDGCCRGRRRGGGSGAAHAAAAAAAAGCFVGGDVCTPEAAGGEWRRVSRTGPQARCRERRVTFYTRNDFVGVLFVPAAAAACVGRGTLKQKLRVPYFKQITP